MSFRRTLENVQSREQHCLHEHQALAGEASDEVNVYS